MCVCVRIFALVILKTCIFNTETDNYSPSASYSSVFATPSSTWSFLSWSSETNYFQHCSFSPLFFTWKWKWKQPLWGKPIPLHPLKPPKLPKPDGKSADLVAQLSADLEALREMGTYQGLPLPLFSFTKRGGGNHGEERLNCYLIPSAAMPLL